MTRLLNILKAITDNYWYIVFVWFIVLAFVTDNIIVEYANITLATIALAVIEITTLIKKDKNDKSN